MRGQNCPHTPDVTVRVTHALRMPSTYFQMLENDVEREMEEPVREDTLALLWFELCYGDLSDHNPAM